MPVPENGNAYGTDYEINQMSFLVQLWILPWKEVLASTVPCTASITSASLHKWSLGTVLPHDSSPCAALQGAALAAQQASTAAYTFHPKSDGKICTGTGLQPALTMCLQF